MAELLPETVLDNQGNEVPTSSLQGGVLGLYFSAHWCPPCRMFTPQLSEWYKKFVENNANKKLNIIFVSSDKNEEQFDEYRKEMSFHSLPFKHREIKAQLSKKFKVQGIPTLVFLDSTGNLITKNGRDIVGSDPEGQEYPWIPKPFKEAVAGPLIDNKGGQTDMSSLEGKYVSFYFSAHWCGPCRHFTPELVKVYNKLKAEGKPWEIVFVSADNSEEEFNDYFGSMPWLSLPFEDKRAEYLNSFFEVSGIPTLVLLDPSGRVLSSDLRSALADDPEGADFPWPRKAVTTLSGGLDSINELPTLISFTDGSEAQIAAAKEALAEVGAEELTRDEPRIQFTYSGSPDEGSIRTQIFGLIRKSDADVPLTTIVDVQSAMHYELPGAPTAATIKDFVSKFLAGSLEGKKFRE